jgi:Zn-dependent peptidase ImmA (M78 family)
MAFFYLPSPPPKEPELHDFRKLPNSSPKALSPNLKLEIRKARYRREKALEIYEELDTAPEKFSLRASPTESVETIAQRIRDYLGVSVGQQNNFRNDYEALNTWRDAAESHGILVFQAPLRKSEARGLAILEVPLPVILLNTKDTPYTRIFTLFHELSHLALRSTGLCDLGDADKTEVFCNTIAGEALVPQKELLIEEGVMRNAGSGYWAESTLRLLSSRYCVSREVILRRLLTLNRTTQAFYQKKREEWKEEYKQGQAKDKGGFSTQPDKVVSHHGKAYTRLVLNGYYNEAINAIDVSEYLGGIKLKHLPKIEEAVFKNSAHRE